MWRIRSAEPHVGLHKQAGRCWDECSGDVTSVEWFRVPQTEADQQHPDSPGSCSCADEPPHTFSSRWQQQAMGLSHGQLLNNAGTTVNMPLSLHQSYVPGNNGNRFFFVGQQSSITDSTDSSDSSNLSTNLASQTGFTQQAALSSFSPQPAVSCSLLSCFSHHHQFMSQSQLQALPATLPRSESSSASPEQLTWLCSGSSPQLGSASLSQSAAAASDELQGFASESCMGSMPLFPVFETIGLGDENDMWAAECPPEDVDQLLDWATNSSLSDPTAESTQLEMPSELNPRSFESASHSVQAAARQLSSNLGSSSLLCDDLRAQSASQTCLADLSTQGAEMSYSDLPAVEAYAEVCAHPSATFLGDDDSLDVDPLELLMQREEASHLETMTCSADPMPSLSARDSSHSRADVQQAGTHDQTDTQKKRCGRPRVYDLDRPVDTDALDAAGVAIRPQRTKGRGAKPKYIYNTAEEAVAKRRKRNRDTATQSYYNRKQRTAMLTKQMEGLTDDNTALETILSIVQHNANIDRGWLREQLLSQKAPACVLQELRQSSACRW